VASVPTGMKTGVSIVPCGNVRTPARALPLVAVTSNFINTRITNVTRRVDESRSRVLGLLFGDVARGSISPTLSPEKVAIAKWHTGCVRRFSIPMRLNNYSPLTSILRLPEQSPWPSLLRRIVLVVGVILLVTVLLYITRGGLRDNTHPDRVLSFVDVLYFTVISVTTVGYGDIVPVTDGARLVNAILLTPVRILVLTAFIGTAYELILQRYREHAHMKRLHGRLDDHIIVCGFGTVGQSIVKELLAHGESADDIIVIEKMKKRHSAPRRWA
jgi:hypothetical protein